MNVKLEGGLGNQLFKYAYGLARAASFNRTALPDGEGHYPATYGLHEFDITPQFDDGPAVAVDFQNERYFPHDTRRLKNQLALGAIIQVRQYSPEESPLHGNLTEDYYIDAIGTLYLPDDFPIRIITDAPAWCAEHLPYPVINTGHRNTDIWLMAAAEHIVISNSSFGWWGAWLGEREGRKVIAPGRWLRTKEHDICPPRWTQIWKDSYFGPT